MKIGPPFHRHSRKAALQIDAKRARYCFANTSFGFLKSGLGKTARNNRAKSNP
jgi:hypothetical protein